MRGRCSQLVKNDESANKIDSVTTIVYFNQLTKNEGQKEGRAWYNYSGDCFDASGEKMKITIWSSNIEANNLQVDQLQDKPIGLVRCGVRISGKYGISLQTGNSTEIVTDPGLIQTNFHGGMNAVEFVHSDQYQTYKQMKSERQNQPNSPNAEGTRTSDIGDCAAAQGPHVTKVVALVQFEQDVERAVY